ncbi:dermonecrotic toxin domain-containing protein, partial [Pseudomonas mosselii]
MTQTTAFPHTNPGEFAESVTPPRTWIAAGRGNALTEADQRRRQAAKALQSLFEQAPSTGAQSHQQHWDSRMPGQSISRRAFAQRQLRVHFQSALEVNHGLDRLQAKALEQGQLSDSTQYAQLHWQQPGTPIGACPGALLIRPTAPGNPWLLYRPDANNPIRAFQDETSLKQWAHEHRQRLWRNPPAALVDDSESNNLEVIAASADGFIDLLDSLLAEQAHTVEFKAELPEALSQDLAQRVSDDDALALEEVHFDTLNERLPLGWRKQRIDRQEQLLATYLGGDTEPTSPRMATLRTHQAKLDELDNALQKLLAKLPETQTEQTWGEASRFEHLSQHFANVLLQEAEFQHTLGELGTPHLAWVHALLERPEPSLQRPIVPGALKLVVGDRTWHLTGYLTLRARAEDYASEPDTSVLLYKPGHEGGLMRFEDEAQLFRQLLNTAQGAWPEALLESAWPQDTDALVQRLDDPDLTPRLVNPPITNHAFDYLVQTHLALLTQADTATQLHLRWKLGASCNTARTQAFERLAERNRTAHLNARLQALKHLDAPQRAALAAAFDALRTAMRASSALLAKDLPERKRFAHDRLHAHLRTTYALTIVPKITLNIADRTGKQRVPLPESGFSNAYKEIVTFSAERSDVALEHFLLWALDEDLRLRLGDARIVFDTPALAPALQQLTNVDIANLVKTLDLAGAYEQQILSAFKGDQQQSEWEAQWRQETLRAPFEQQLKILALSQPAALDEDGTEVFQRFCREQLDATVTNTVSHRSLDLRPGVAADGSASNVPLAGLFLLEAASGPVLLLMPDAPNGKVVSQHASHKAACQALEEMAIDEAMRSFLASRPLDGDSQTHLSYINQALLKSFSGFIAAGTSRSEPIAEVQASLLMGRLIMEHRASSRSQTDLFLENAAISHGRVYDYIKLALGFLPGVGALVALYDGWHAANASVEAFLRGDPGECVEHLNSVFQSLFDAVFDLTPTVLASNPQALARTRSRQQLAGLRATTVTRQGRPQPFQGYASEAPAGHWAAHPQPHGRGVHRHVESGDDYILHQGAHYPVEWDATYLTWRLKGSASRTYKQPVRLDELGGWQPHGGLSGRLVDGGLSGGGAFLGRLYQQGWENLRGYLGRQPALRSPQQVALDIDRGRLTQQAEVTASLDRLKRAIADHRASSATPITQSRAVLQAQHAYTEQLQTFVTFHEQSLARLRSNRALSGHMPRQFRDGLAFNLVHQHPSLIRQYQFQMQGHFDEVRRLQHALDTNPTDPLAQLKALRAEQGRMAHSLEKLETEFRRAATLRNTVQGPQLTTYQLELDKLGMPLDPNGYRVVRLSIQAANVIRLPATAGYDFLLALRQINRELTHLRNMLFSHQDMTSAGLSRAQEHRFLQQVKARYQRFDNQMTNWQDTFPDLVTAQSTHAMRAELATLM